MVEHDGEASIHCDCHTCRLARIEKSIDAMRATLETLIEDNGRADSTRPTGKHRRGPRA